MEAISARRDAFLAKRLAALPAGLQPRLARSERIVLIDNPASGGRTYAPWAQYAWQMYRALGYDAELVETQRPGHAVELVREAVDRGATLVIACSGDGGVRETLIGLMAITDPAARPRFSVIPKGTANILAKTLGLQLGPVPDFFHPVLKQLYWSRRRRIDLGMLDGEAFACFAGFGFDAAVIERVEPEEKRRFKEWAFVKAALSVLFGWESGQGGFQPYVPEPLRIEAPDAEGRWRRHDGWFAAVGNVQDYGTKMFPFMHGARLDDGLLDVVVVQTRDMPELLRLGAQVLTRTHHRNPHVQLFRSPGPILVQSLGKAVPMHADSELVGSRSASRITVAPGAIEVVY